MKKTTIVKQFALGTLCVCLCMALGWQTQAAEVIDLKRWQDGVKSGQILPFSFKLGKKAAEFDFVDAVDTIGDAGWHNTKVSYQEKTQPLTVELICEFPPTMDMVRTTLKLKANGKVAGHVRDINILDLKVSNRKATIHGQTGGFSEDPSKFPPTGSVPWIKQIPEAEQLKVHSGNDGRSSNEQLPIWLYAEEDAGLWYGPEWSGCWAMNVQPTSNGKRILVGLPTFDFSINPQETITLPTAAFGPYAGLPRNGFNQLRRMIYQYYLPMIDGKKPQPLVYWEGYRGHPAHATEEELYQEVDRAAEIGCEVFCLDGGWNMPPESAGRWHGMVGRWEDECRFPKGVRTFGDYIKNKGMKFGIWIEPRATPGCDLYNKHKGLFYPGPHALMRLDLPGGPEMFQGVFDQLIRDYGVNWVWLDYNVAPRPYWWNQTESPDRKGLQELGFYQGWYKAIEETMKKYPNLWIESCASGGRIIDLGQLRRSHSIWVADEAFIDDTCRNRRHALNLVLPAVYIQNSMFLAPDLVHHAKRGLQLGGGHRFLTYFTGDLGFGQGLPYWSDEDIQTAAKYTKLYKKFRHYLEEDYYHLLPLPMSRDAWDACQYHDPQKQSGIVLAFRLSESKSKETVIRPCAIDNMKQYNWSIVAGDATIQVSGDCLKIQMDTPNSCLIHYQRK